MSEPADCTIHIDGGSRGNPGPASFAFVLQPRGAPAIEENGYLGSTTNNIAEYTALVRALERAASLALKRLHVLSDSELLVRQMNGQYRVKNERLLPLYETAKSLVEKFEHVHIQHIPRSQNSRADRLCNQALDRAEKAHPLKVRKAKPSANGSSRADAIRDEAVACLRAAAAAWAQGNGSNPPPEQVWDQLWSIVEEHGVLHSKSR